MIQKFVDRFMSSDLRQRYVSAPPQDYDQIFNDVCGVIRDENEYPTLDLDRITVIDHGDYQGSRLFVVGASGYQPSTYWACLVSYGSCSSCDSFQSVEGTPEEKAEGFWTLGLHMVQSMKVIE